MCVHGIHKDSVCTESIQRGYISSNSYLHRILPTHLAGMFPPTQHKRGQDMLRISPNPSGALMYYKDTGTCGGNESQR